MAIARRVYLYGIAFIALGMLVWGLTGLLEMLLTTLIGAALPVPVSFGGNPVRGRISFSGSLAAIGLVAWSIHWWLADRSARQAGPDGWAERRSALRKLFLYGALAIGSILLTIALAVLVTQVLLAVFGRLTVANLLTGAIAGPVAGLAIIGAFWAYHTRVAGADRAVEPEAGAGATLRRWHAYLPAFTGLMMATIAAAGLFRLVWETVVMRLAPPAATIGSAGIGGEVAGRIGALIAGLALWIGYWRWSTDWFHATGDRDPEARSVLRKVYLYLVLAVAIAWTVWNLGGILNGLLRQILITDDPGVTVAVVIRELGRPIAYVLTFGAIWLYHARVVGREAAVAGERGRQAAIRWIYYYLVALVAIVTFAIGLAGAASTLIDLIIQPGASRPTHWWQDRFSLFSTLVVVGLPIWAWVWTGLQREARDPFARGSLIRRIYLLLAIAATVVTILGSGAYTLYLVIRLVLGETWSAGQTSELITTATAAAVAALLLTYHLRVFRQDLLETVPAPVAAPEPAPAGVTHYAIALVRGPDRAAITAWQEAQTRELPPGVEVDVREVDAETARRWGDLTP